MVIVNITASKRRFGESGRIYFVRRVIVNITVSRRLSLESGKIDSVTMAKDKHKCITKVPWKSVL